MAESVKTTKEYAGTSVNTPGREIQILRSLIETEKEKPRNCTLHLLPY